VIKLLLIVAALADFGLAVLLIAVLLIAVSSFLFGFGRKACMQVL